MMILRIVLLLLLASCASTPEEKQEREDYAERANIRYAEVKKYCSSKGLPVGVDCDAGRGICHKYPNSREKLTAHCVIWRDKAKFDHSMSSRVLRDAQRQAEIGARR